MAPFTKINISKLFFVGISKLQANTIAGHEEGIEYLISFSTVISNWKSIQVAATVEKLRDSTFILHKPRGAFITAYALMNEYSKATHYILWSMIPLTS